MKAVVQILPAVFIGTFFMLPGISLLAKIFLALFLLAIASLNWLSRWITQNYSKRPVPLTHLKESSNLGTPGLRIALAKEKLERHGSLRLSSGE
jgi:hypothetical protein